MACCGNSAVRVKLAESIPAVTLRPDLLNLTLKRLEINGLQVFKISSGGSKKPKNIQLERGAQILKYTPSVKKGKAQFHLRDVVEISRAAAKFQNTGGIDFNSVVSVVLNTGKSFDFVALSINEAEMLEQGIAFLVRRYRAVLDENPHKTRVMDLWISADANNDQKLVYNELQELVKRLNVNITPEELKTQFIKFDVDASGFLDYEEFMSFFDSITQRPELLPLFETYSVAEKGIIITTGELETFFEKQQGEKIFPETVKEIVSHYGVTAKKDGLDFTEFCRLLMDPKHNSWFNPKHEVLFQDMTHPLTSYFINSSHNTYLSGDQLQSKSKVEMYVNALRAGCRCVELDCWDGPNNDPIVYHGYTRTSKIRFQDIIRGIKDHAFETSPYPVILSLEVHTSLPQQVQMGRIMTQIFGTSLATKEDMAKSNSPEGLKHKILIKWKELVTDEDDAKEASQEIVKAQTEAKVVVDSRAAPELCRTVTVAAKKVKDWGESANPHWIQSYAEGKMTSFLHKERANFTLQNSRMLSRIYPAGSRVDSSNYSPLPAWAMGSQIVALNYQTWDAPMRLNSGRFAVNGNSGYVLKPVYLRTDDVRPPTEIYELTVNVILGVQLPKPAQSNKGEVIDPFVVVSVQNGVAPVQEFRTATVDDNGFSPYWNEKFKFSISELELSMLTIRVMDSDVAADDEVCEATIPLTSLRLGYRAVPMQLCTDGRPLEFTTVLCHFSMK